MWIVLFAHSVIDSPTPDLKRICAVKATGDQGVPLADFFNHRSTRMDADFHHVSERSDLKSSPQRRTFLKKNTDAWIRVIPRDKT
jgi:hypothetical protein